MDFTGQNVLVMGLGLSGCSAARYLAERGARVVAADERPAEAIADLANLPSGIETRLGSEFRGLEDFDLVVPSPGIPKARWAGCARRAWGDIELCYRALPIPIIAVTGTNGKSTVVRLIEAMANAAGLRARAAGNLGIPALDLVGAPLDVAILEVSSFQLEAVERFRPRAGVLLNISPDHLDRHGDLAGYRAAKARLFAAQEAGDFAIVNGEDPLTADIDLPEGVERLPFKRSGPLAKGAWLEGQNAVIRRGTRHEQFSLDGLGALAEQSDNVLAALLALSTFDLDLGKAISGLFSFSPLPHRAELVCEIDGVRYVDDSKATNVGAASRSLETLRGPILWIAGGRHKGGDLRELVASATGRVRHAFLIGEAEDAFSDALANTVPHDCVGDLESAVQEARAMAQQGDLVLLAPACASFDQFENFEARGDHFRMLVQQPREGGAKDASRHGVER